MRDFSLKPQQREVIVAAGAGLLWSALGVILSTALHEHALATPCRIHNQLPGGVVNVGSGTLIDVAASHDRGLVLTCAHLFAEGTGRVAVEFPGSRTHGALVVAVDAQADLAALEISRPAAEPTQVSAQLTPTARLRACGFGPSGDFRCVHGPVAGYSESPGRMSVRIAGAVRSGDSGGGVFDGQGRLCAVVWGEADGVTYASTGQLLRAFLDRVLVQPPRGARQPPQLASTCPTGLCPLAPPAPIIPRQPPQRPATIGAAPVAELAPSTAAPGTSPNCDCGDKIAAINARLDGLSEHAASESAAAPPLNVGAAARAAALLAVGALGISGPAGWGVIAAATLGGWAVGRRLKRRRSRSAGTSPTPPAAVQQPSQLRHSQEATAAAETSFPIERDDREARELLRLSQLEGRDPLQDALAGRIALDRLDAIAEGDADPSQAGWADRLRRELRERFNEIAPTKFQG